MTDPNVLHIVTLDLIGFGHCKLPRQQICYFNVLASCVFIGMTRLLGIGKSKLFHSLGGQVMTHLDTLRAGHGGNCARAC